MADPDTDPDQHQNWITSSFSHAEHFLKISSKSIHYFLSYFVHRQTDRQTNSPENITSLAEVINFTVYSFIFKYSQTKFQKCSTLYVNTGKICSRGEWGKMSHFYIRQGGYVFGRVCLSVRPSVCEQNNSKSKGRIWMKFSGNVQHGKRKNWFDFGVDPDWRLFAMAKNVIAVNNYWTKNRYNYESI